MEETIVEIIISEGQNEVADFQKWGADISRSNATAASIRIQILPLQILNERTLQQPLIRNHLHDHRHRVHPASLAACNRRSPATSCNRPVMPPHHQRLNNPMTAPDCTTSAWLRVKLEFPHRHTSTRL